MRMERVNDYFCNSWAKKVVEEEARDSNRWVFLKNEGLGVIIYKSHDGRFPSLLGSYKWTLVGDTGTCAFETFILDLCHLALFLDPTSMS